MEVDFEELVKQQKEEILKSGKYAKVEIVVGEDEGQPLAHVECKATVKEMATLIKTMEEVKKAIIKKEPLVLLALQRVNFNGSVIKDSREDDIETMNDYNPDEDDLPF